MFALVDKVFSFAEWAFGSDGIQSLQVVGYGDFSLDGRFQEESVILLRDAAEPYGFRPAGPDDGLRMKELFDANNEFFTACPAYSFLGRRGEYSGETSTSGT
jgi:hypothetical protein